MKTQIQTYKQITLTSYSPKTINKQFKITNIKQALELKKQHNIPSFGKLQQQKGEGFVRSVLVIWLVNLNEFIYGNDHNKALTESQIEQTTEILLARYEFRNITITDLSLIFRKAFSGEYGKLYGRLRPDIIIDWFLMYFDDRCNTAENNSTQEHQKTKNILSHVPRNANDKTKLKEQFHDANLWYLKQYKKTDN